MKRNFDLRVLILHWNRGRWTANDMRESKKLCTGVERWVFAMDGDYCNTLEIKEKELLNYDIVILNSDINHPKYFRKICKLVENRPKGVTWITLVEGDMSIYKPDKNLQKVFDNSDFVVCINKYTKEFWEKFTKTKVEFIGVPYPVDEVRKLSIKTEKRLKQCIICPSLLIRYQDFLVARELGIDMIGFEKRFSHKFKTVFKNRTLKRDFYLQKAEKIYQGNNLKILLEKSFEKYFNFTANSFIMINLDNRYTWGRYVLDAAALQIPIITTISTGHGLDLFPELCLDNENQIEKAIEIGKRLIENKDFYEHVSNIPIEKLDIYKEDYMKKKLLKFINY
ncbi:MAG: hypothetical protein WCT77_05135 [Bacteroidota bacterium]